MAFKLLKARIYGRVQGVGYRWYTQRMAQLLSVTGWVKNRPDGGVEIEAIGTDEKIREFLLTLNHGPSMSSVESIEQNITDCDYNTYSSFDIKH